MEYFLKIFFKELDWLVFFRILLQLTEAPTVQAAENTTHRDTIMFLKPVCHSLDNLGNCLGLIVWISLVERHGCTDILESAMFGVFSDHSGLLGLKDPIVSFQLSIALLELSV